MASRYYGSLNDRVVIDPENNVAEMQQQQFKPVGRSKKPFFITIAVIVVGTIAALGLSATSGSAPFSILNFRERGAMRGTEDGDEASIQFTMVRKGYSTLSYFDPDDDSADYMTYSVLSDIGAIIEPSADMSMALLGDSESSDSSYRYRVCDYETNSACYVGEFSPSVAEKTSYVNVPCTPYTKYLVSASEVDSTGTTVASSTITALCLYVRREISSLTQGDLEATMDAMYTLWTVSDSDGQSKFGTNYHSASYFSAAHDFNAAQRDADHIHEGLGFLPQHLKLTNMYEKAIQAVNPAISLPYWDFTIDVSKNLTIYESMMFTADTFGSITKPVDEFWGFTYRNDNLEDTYILDGRWANLKAEKNTRFPDLSNGFGYMRGPWNMNPNPHVSRFSSYTPSLPTCADYYGGLSMKDLIQFLETAPYGSHASTHGVIGGVFGCDKLDSLRENGIIKDEDSQLAICKKWGFYMKELYRSNFLSPDTDCTVNSLTEDGISCGFVCNTDAYDLMPSQIQSIINADYLKSTTAESYEEWRTLICSGDGYRIFVGDHLESASPSDPSFWPIHPTLERLMQAKFMVKSFDSYIWPSDAVNGYVCDKAKCYEETYGAKDYYSECCYGHYENDQLLDFVNADTSRYVGDTNAKVLKDVDPTGDYAMNYIYDNFKWEHCSEDFPSKLDELYTAYAETISSSPTLEPTVFVPETDTPSFKPTPCPSFAPTHQPSLKPTRTPTIAEDKNEDEDEDENSHDEEEEEQEEEKESDDEVHISPTLAPTTFTVPTRSYQPTHAPTLAPSVASHDDDEATAKPTYKPTKSPSYTAKPTKAPTKAPVAMNAKSSSRGNNGSKAKRSNAKKANNKK